MKLVHFAELDGKPQVAPHAGARVETVSKGVRTLKERSRPPRGGAS